MLSRMPPRDRPSGMSQPFQGAIPGEFRTPGEFVHGLRLLRVEAGDPSLRDLARVTGVPRSTLAVLFDARRSRLPRRDRCVAVLRALGVDEPRVLEWAAAWKRIQGAELAEFDAARPPETSAIDGDRVEADGSDPIEAAENGVVSALRDRGRYGRGHLAAAFAAGVALTVIATLVGLQVYRTVQGPAPVLVGDYAICRPGELASNPPATESNMSAGGPSVAGPARWVARPAADKQVLTTAHVTLPFTSTVTEGHALIVTVMLTSTCPGDVTVTDTQRDRYRIVADVADSSRHRVLVIAAFAVGSLTTADSLSISYPQASKYHVAVDEFSGLSAAGQSATSSGSAGGTAFSTGPTPHPCTAGQLQIAAIGTNSGTAPTPSDGWTIIDEPLRLSSYRLTTAYRVTREPGPCAATGTTTAQWAAALATFS